MKKLFFAILIVLVISQYTCNKTLENPNSIAENYLRILIESDQSLEKTIEDLFYISNAQSTADTDYHLIPYFRSKKMRFSELKVWQTEEEPNRATVRARGIVVGNTSGKSEECVLDAELHLERQDGKWKIVKTIDVMPVNAGITLEFLKLRMEEFSGSHELNNSIKDLLAQTINLKIEGALKKFKTDFGKIRSDTFTNEQVLVLNMFATLFVENHVRGGKRATLYEPNYDKILLEPEDKTEIAPYEVAVSLSLTALFLQVVREIFPETKDNWRVLVLDSRYVLPVIYVNPSNETGGIAYDLMQKHLGFRIDDESIWVKSLFEGVSHVEVHPPPW